MSPRKRSFRRDLFNNTSFASLEDVEAALSELEQLLRKDNYLHVIEDLFDSPLAVELVLSGLHDAKPLTKWLIDTFPTSHSAYNASIASKLLLHLSAFFFIFHPPAPFQSEATQQLISLYHRGVMATPKLLDALSSMDFEKPDAEVEDADEDEESIPNFFKVKVKVKKPKIRSKQNIGKVNTSKTPANLKLLADFHIPIPHDHCEADHAIAKVLADAKSILQFYLDTLRVPEVVYSIQQAAISTNPTHAPLEVETQVAFIPSEEKPNSEIPPAYPMVQPMKSALHFSSAEGFGDWRILISTRADRDLRQARRKDRKTFTITVKKIKELSNGHFSDDNQKRLNGPTTDVPIFEAKMTSDTRLVYQVDSVSDYDSNVERQVIRIFGVYTHAQLDDRLWHSIGRQLGKKGKEYKRRCMHRERPVNTGDNVFLPASFPPMQVETTTNSTFMDLPPDDLEEIHSLLVLEKYLTFSQELLHSILADLDVAFPFQVSPQEKEIIEHPHSCYVLGRSGTGKTTTMLFKMLWIERTFQLNNQDLVKPRQIFVTKSRVLAGKVEEYFLKLLESLKTASQSAEELQKLVQAKKKAQAEEVNLVDIDDEDDWRGDLPSKFSELQGIHFPLFITFDRLCELIEADFDLSDRSYSIRENKQLRTLVTYDLFLHHYWPHFAQQLVKGLDPALVFSEIIGIIKGSEETISSHGYLDRKTYENLSERTQSTFATKRSVIYSIFEAYQARKKQQGDFDTADRTHGILRILESHGVMGQKIDHLYVDEAQDNLLIDALLLRSLSCNTDGLFWAGDTAQTISVGSSFRFDDLKAFLFRIEKQRLQNKLLTDSIHQGHNSPKTFQLATNYRSHAGIVNCAHSVIELITQFWPYSIDTLAPEKGIVDGLKPVFLNGWDTDNVRYEQFLFGSSGSHIEFGAQQCILVRDELARQKLQEQVGDIGLIMTLYESKGLEFNDVLLFNFFEDSTLELSQWRLLLTATNITAKNVVAAPQFDPTRHAGVCAELKFLYVAITRARKNLWIADKSTKGEPMRTFWTAMDQIHNCTPGTDMPRLAVSSSPEEWATKGKELFERKKFLQAKHCYERAQMPRAMAISNAYYLREQARKSPLGDSRRIRDERNSAFTRAAEAFLICTNDPSKNRIVYFRRAAECFEAGADNLRAAHTYVDAHEYDAAAKLYRKLGLFDEAVAIIKANEEHMHSDVVESIKDVARLYYFREDKLQKARELFSTDEEELEYLEDLDLDVARAEVLVSLGRPAEAAELHLSEGRTLDAIPLFLKDSNNVASMRQASHCILQEFWRHLSFGVIPTKTTIIVQLLDWSLLLNRELLETKDFEEITMFKAIVAYEGAELAKLGSSFLRQNTRCAVLCLHHYFQNFPRVTGKTVLELGNILSLFLAYIGILYDLAFRVDPRVAPPSVHKLFGIQRSTADEYLVPAGTFFHLSATSSRRSQLPSDLGVSISGWDFCQIFKRAICEHLSQRIAVHDDLWRHVPQLSPCLTFVTSAYCNRVACPKEHTPASSLSIEWYNARVRITLQQVLILQSLYFVRNGGNGDSERKKRLHINRFYDALNPPSHHLGAFSLLDINLIPEFQKGIHVIKDWLRGVAYKLDHFSTVQQDFVSYLIRSSTLGLAYDEHALEYLRRSPYLSSQAPSTLYLSQPVGRFILPDITASLHRREPWSIAVGVHSVKHILDSKIPINVSVLCDFIEYLCASLAASAVCARGSFHSLALPRSWLYRQIREPEKAKGKDTQSRLFLVVTMAALLETMYTGAGAEHLLFENRDLSAIAGIRGIFIARICRALCLLGYNANNAFLKSNIWKTITSLYRGDRKFSAAYQQYVSSRRWEDLVRALRNSFNGVLVDEFVQLHCAKWGPPKAAPGVRLVVYENDYDLVRLLVGRNSPREAAQDQNREIEPTIHMNQSTHDIKESYVEENAEILEEETQNTDDDLTEPQPLANQLSEIENLPVISSSDMARPPTAEERQAALVIQHAYKRKLLHRRQEAKKGLSASRARKFSACLEAAQNLHWKSSIYRMHFLGPLPHLLLCLEISYDAAVIHKKGLKKLLISESHERLEGLGLRLTELGRISKRIFGLQKALEPTSEFHIRCDVAGLRKIVEESVRLIQNLPFNTPNDLHEDLHIAYKGIVALPQPPKPLQRPSLVCEPNI